MWGDDEADMGSPSKENDRSEKETEIEDGKMKVKN
jgi:hypothetical protein